MDEFSVSFLPYTQALQELKIPALNQKKAIREELCQQSLLRKQRKRLGITS
jgi:hypothetical protein